MGQHPEGYVPASASLQEEGGERTGSWVSGQEPGVALAALTPLPAQKEAAEYSRRTQNCSERPRAF